MTRFLTVNRLFLLFGVLGFGFIVFYLFAASTIFTYDEPYYLSNLQLISKYGLGKEFLIHLKGPAGPLFAYLHYILLPFTNLDIISTRLVNLFFGLLIVFILRKILSYGTPANKNIAFLFFCIPMSYPTIGMALTEIPAMFFFTLALFLFFVGINKKSHNLIFYIIAILSGLCLGISIMGRQPYLLCLGAGVIALYFYRDKNHLLWFLVFLISALLIPLIVFDIWQGLVPKEGGLIATRGGLVPINFIFALGYSTIIMFILSPSFFMGISKFPQWVYLFIFVISILICRFFNFSFVPLSGLMNKFFSGSLVAFFGNLVASIFLTISIYFLHCFIEGMYKHRWNFMYMVVSVMLLLLLVSCISITHQFSSRYVFQGAPLFLIISSHYIDHRVSYRLFFPVVGIILGVLSLSSYY